MKRLALLLLILLPIFALQLAAQDTLPKFSVKNIGNKRIVIGWVNTFESVTQISIQRSFDSLKNFKTILTVADPTTPENGYVDTKANTDYMFYRLYIQLDKGAFIFSDPKRPVLDTAVKISTRLQRPGSPGQTTQLPILPADSANNTPYLATDNRPKAERWAPSKFVYTFKDGYIRISLPEDNKKYDIKFFTSDDEPVFELKDIKQKSFKLDKTNFYKSGWFKFELYEDGELKEKNRFFLPKEF